MSGSLIILVIAFVVQLIAQKASDGHRRLFGISVLGLAMAVIFGQALYQSLQQYLIWKSNDLGKLFLPPYQNWDYFVFYVRVRFFNPYFLSLGLGLLALVSTQYFNRKYNERFFEILEPYIFATAIFIVGHPLWLFYLSILLTISIFISCFLRFMSQKEDHRFSLYYFWLPIAILTILISRWLEILPWWQILKV